MTLKVTQATQTKSSVLSPLPPRRLSAWAEGCGIYRDLAHLPFRGELKRVSLIENCTICLTPLLEDQEVSGSKMRDVATQTQQACTPFAEMSCGHLFHKSCIEKSLIYRSLSCPICRHNYVPTEKYKEIQQRGQLLCQRTYSLDQEGIQSTLESGKVWVKDVLESIEIAALSGRYEATRCIQTLARFHSLSKDEMAKLFSTILASHLGSKSMLDPVRCLLQEANISEKCRADSVEKALQLEFKEYQNYRLESNGLSSILINSGEINSEGREKILICMREHERLNGKISPSLETWVEQTRRHLKRQFFSDKSVREKHGTPFSTSFLDTLVYDDVFNKDQFEKHLSNFFALLQLRNKNTTENRFILELLLESPLFSNEDKRNYLRQIRSKNILSGVDYSTFRNMTELLLELNEDA